MIVADSDHSRDRQGGSQGSPISGRLGSVTGDGWLCPLSRHLRVRPSNREVGGKAVVPAQLGRIKPVRRSRPRCDDLGGHPTSQNYSHDKILSLLCDKD